MIINAPEAMPAGRHPSKDARCEQAGYFGRAVSMMQAWATAKKGSQVCLMWGRSKARAIYT